MVRRYTVLAAATVASLSCGLNYCFSRVPLASLSLSATLSVADLMEWTACSAYAPQLGTRLHLTSTQLNTVGAAGNLGVYLSCASSLVLRRQLPT